MGVPNLPTFGVEHEHWELRSSCRVAPLEQDYDEESSKVHVPVDGGGDAAGNPDEGGDGGGGIMDSAPTVIK